MTTRISFDLCLKIYKAEVKAGPLLFEDKLKGALNAPFQAFGAQEFYPSLLQKAAKLAYGIAEAQAFRDGNKRIAWLVTVIFLELNGVTLDVDQDEAAHVIRAIGTRDPITDVKQLDEDGLVAWLASCAHSAHRP
ncbi:MAG: Fic family protein [Propionibacteriaceae bacterium]|nr:Fic family protein [Propionibacteriaceae bacterium]